MIVSQLFLLAVVPGYCYSYWQLYLVPAIPTGSYTARLLFLLAVVFGSCYSYWQLYLAPAIPTGSCTWLVLTIWPGHSFPYCQYCHLIILKRNLLFKSN
jgi:hypothetical protein